MTRFEVKRDRPNDNHFWRYADKNISDIAVGDVLDMTHHACECYLLRIDDNEKEC